MTHDPNVLNVLSYSLDGRLFKLRADRFFWHAICFGFMRVLPYEKAGRSSAVFSKFMLGVIVSYMYLGPLFVTGSITRALRLTNG